MSESNIGGAVAFAGILIFIGLWWCANALNRIAFALGKRDES